MTTRRRVIRIGGQRLTSDTMMGLAGCGLAVASTSFGIFMTIHGPAPGFGTSHDFTVFAQLGPHGSGPRERAVPPRAGEDLDMTATASIPRGAGSSQDPASLGETGDAKVAAEKVATIMASATVQTATADAATIAIDGRVRTVHVGDSLPDLGDVISITPGRRPSVRTSRGVIFAASEP
jgi:hypothetical protein